MKVIRTKIDGVVLLEPHFLADSRGFFYEIFKDTLAMEIGAPKFVQDNHSQSKKGVLRGMHFQVSRPQGQLVTVLRGEIFDAVVDLRPRSKTFGQWIGVHLSDCSTRQIYMPPGFAHGFLVLSDEADLHYKVSEIYDHSDEGGLLWNDPAIGIKWPNQVTTISERDKNYPCLQDIPFSRLPWQGGSK